MPASPTASLPSDRPEILCGHQSNLSNNFASICGVHDFCSCPTGVRNIGTLRRWGSDPFSSSADRRRPTAAPRGQMDRDSAIGLEHLPPSTLLLQSITDPHHPGSTSSVWFPRTLDKHATKYGHLKDGFKCSIHGRQRQALPAALCRPSLHTCDWCDRTSGKRLVRPPKSPRHNVRRPYLQSLRRRAHEKQECLVPGKPFPTRST